MTSRDTELMVRGIAEWKAEQQALQAKSPACLTLEKRIETPAGAVRSQIATGRAPVMSPPAAVRGFSLGFARDIFAAAAEVFGVRSGDMESDARAYPIAHARQAAWLVMYECTAAGAGKIALASKRHHTSVLSGLASARKRMATDKDYARKVQVLWTAVMQSGSGMERAA